MQATLQSGSSVVFLVTGVVSIFGLPACVDSDRSYNAVRLEEEGGRTAQSDAGGSTHIDGSAQTGVVARATETGATGNDVNSPTPVEREASVSTSPSDGGGHASDASRNETSFPTDASPSTAPDASELSRATDTLAVDAQVAETNRLPTIDGDCDRSGSLACDINNPTQKLVCSQGLWQSNGGCDDGENCDPEDSRCKAIVPECEESVSGERRCGPDDELLVCGPNWVSIESREVCAGRCVSASDVAECAAPFCGDGKTQEGEVCDDGNADNTDGCTEGCAPPACGDGFPNNGENCDDGDSDNSDECTQLCAPPTCGDGFVNNDEQCDELTEEGRARCAPLCHWKVSVEAGASYSCSSRGDGRAKCWGYNQYGQLGLGNSTQYGDSSNEMGDELPLVNLGTDRTPVAITAGELHTCAILDDGSLKCWGYNQYGQLGLGNSTQYGDSSNEMGDGLPPVNLGTGRTAVAVTTGMHYTCAILDDASVKCWGHNQYGQLGLGNSTQYGDSSNEMGDELPPVNLGTGRTAVAITAGDLHTCAILDDESLKCWGHNDYGQLGLGITTSRYGDSSNEMGDGLPPVNLGTGRTAVAVSAGMYHTCAILDDHSVKCWGQNDYGQLGLGNDIQHGDSSYTIGDELPPVNLGTDRKAVAITAGQRHTCAILDHHSIKCWGYNQYGQLGLGNTTQYGDSSNEMGDALPLVNLGTARTAVAVTAGKDHTCAVLDDASIKCWGNNQNGQLGLGNTTRYGDSSNEMGDALTVVSLW